jgi:hypothetical protein
MSAGEQQRWIYHAANKSRRYPGVVSYAYFLLEKSDFNQLGKMMKDGIGRDDSLLGKTEGSAESANYHRKKRLEKSSSTNQKHNSESDSLAAAIRESMKYEVKSSLLQFTFLHGSAADKLVAMKRMEGMMKDDITDDGEVNSSNRKRSLISDISKRPKAIQRTKR